MKRIVLLLMILACMPLIMGLGVSLWPGGTSTSDGLNFYKETFTNDASVNAPECAQWNADAMITTGCTSPKVFFFIPSDMQLQDVRFYVMATAALGATEACDVVLEKGVGTDLLNATAVLETIQVGGTSSVTAQGDSEIDCCSGTTVDGDEWLRVKYADTVASCDLLQSVRVAVVGTLVEVP